MNESFSFLTTMLGVAIRCVVLIGSRVIGAVSVMASVVYYFEKIKRCPSIKDEIILYPAYVLADKIRRRELTSELVIRAYINRIKEVNPIVNAVVEERFDEAIKEAQQIDNSLSKTSLTIDQLEQQFPLLGIPITVKESIAVKGMSHSSGKVFADGKRAVKDAEIVTLCKRAGAIPLIVSNTPQLCSNFETYNDITGKTRNPYDTRRSPGGSSGGEAALLGAGASVIGLGSDIYGSIRLPAHYCGIFGHKPSPNVISVDGHYPDCKHEKEWNDIFNLGPMCRYAADLHLVMKVITKESYNSVMHLSQEIQFPNIKVYYMDNDNKSMLTHSIDEEIVSGIRRIASHMATKYGCRTKELKMKEFKYSPEVSVAKLFNIDDIEPLFTDDEFSSKELVRYLTFRSESFLAPIFCGILKKVLRHTPKAVSNRISKLEIQFKTKLYQTLGNDGVLIYPCHPTTAPIHYQGFGRLLDYSYVGIFNTLGLPVTNCPLGLNSEGLPIGIQIAAAPNNDRLTLAIAREIEIAFGGWIPPQFQKS